MKKRDENVVTGKAENEPQKIEKKLFVITAVLMGVMGLVLGLYAVEFLSVYFPDTTPAQYAVTCAITAAILALVMLSLSKPVCKLLKILMEKLQTSLSTRPVYKSMSVVFGLMFGVSAAILAGAVLSVFVDGLPGIVYAFIIGASFVVLSYVAAVVFSKILGSNALTAADYQRGYVIASSAFSSEKTLKLVPKLIGKIAVMDVTVSRLSAALIEAQTEGGDVAEKQKAFDCYMRLESLVNVRLANGNPALSETENIVALAHSQKFKIIALDKLELFDDNDLDVLYLSEI
ncbi:MAG: hypothetical protein ACI4SC_01140 [Candidatus Neoclostridium sp.]